MTGDTETGTTHLIEESPYGECPEDDVACADCGAYRTLFGPIDQQGNRHRHGDFVCRSCVAYRSEGSA